MISRITRDGLLWSWAIILILCIAVSQARGEPVYVDRCSGTYIGNGYVLTAAHCVENMLSTTLKKDKEDAGGWTAKVVMTDHLRDVAVLQFDKVMTKDKDGNYVPGDAYKDLPFTATKVSCTYPKVMDKFTAKGWPAGMYLESTGYVAGDKAKRGPWPVSYLMIMAGAGGSSGSGLYNGNTGTVDAIVVGWIPGSGIMIAVPTAEVCNIVPH